MPPTIIKVINGGEGSLQEFVEDAQVGKEVGYGEIDKYEEAKLSIFDILIANTDRHRGNYLVKDGKIFAIDHGFSLGREELQGGCLIKDVPPGIVDKLRKFFGSEEQKSILHDLLVELLGKSVADLFMKRVSAFVESINDDCSFNRLKFSRLMDINFFKI